MLSLLLAVAVAAGQAELIGGGGCQAGSVCSARSMLLKTSTSTAMLQCYGSTNATRPAYAWWRNGAAIELRQCADNRCASCPTTAWSIGTPNSGVMQSSSDLSLLDTYNLKFRNRFSIAANWLTIASMGVLTTGNPEFFWNSTSGKLWWGDPGTALVGLRPLGSESHPVFDAAAMTIRPGGEAAVCPMVMKPLPTMAGGVAATFACAGAGSSFATAAGTQTGRRYVSLTTGAADENVHTGVTETIVQVGQWPRACGWVRTPASLSAVRIWFGLTSSAFAVDEDAPTSKNVAAFRYSTEAGDGPRWTVVSCSSSAVACTGQDTGVAIAASTEYLLCAEYNSVSRVVWTIHTGGGTQTSGTITTNVATTTATNLLFSVLVQTEENVAKALGLAVANIEAR